MQSFTIRDIENLTGIKAHTWRIWEQRFPIFHAKRKESLHRVYDNEDLKQLLRIAFLYHNGWKVSKIAQLNAQAILEEVSKAEPEESNYKQYVLQLIEAAIDFNEKAFTSLLEEFIERMGFEKCITDLCYPYLQRVGLLWVTNRVIPAQEHFSSYIIQNKIIAETEKLNKPPQSPELLLFSPQGEFHELPLLYINYLLRKNGWGVVYLGINAKRDILQQFTSNPNLQYLFLHQITNFTHYDADDYLEILIKTFPGKNIVVTGTIVMNVHRPFTNLILLKSDQEIIDFITHHS
ncbi:MerR family transcriptional regulator [Chitinophagaceae bacterium LB-8]|uniref:MerR family transcriptional regulator n=1 Tax=Paraflavisolibacter caeni TaxID=2982496 RepID=A0A9X3BGU5_9BACT|nr:B12-binding domain-containing protein [Paraflavisolibacter caeni]MCU7551514.1 MerR family transcriptional regulator [Paraflavisolibacter caeni]